MSQRLNVTENRKINRNNYPLIVPDLINKILLDKQKELNIEFLKVHDQLVFNNKGNVIITAGLKGYVLRGYLNADDISDISVSLSLSNEAKRIILDRIYLFDTSTKDQSYESIWCPLPINKIRETKGEVSHGLVKWIPQVGLLSNDNSRISLECSSPIHNSWEGTISTSYKSLWANEENIHLYRNLIK